MAWCRTWNEVGHAKVPEQVDESSSGAAVTSPARVMLVKASGASFTYIDLLCRVPVPHDVAYWHSGLALVTVWW